MRTEETELAAVCVAPENTPGALQEIHVRSEVSVFRHCRAVKLASGKRSWQTDVLPAGR